MKLLIVEDRESNRVSYEDEIDKFVEESNNLLTHTFAGSLTEAKELVSGQSFDGAIVDLRLSGTTTEAEGNEIIRMIIEKRSFP